MNIERFNYLEFSENVFEDLKSLKPYELIFIATTKNSEFYAFQEIAKELLIQKRIEDDRKKHKHTLIITLVANTLNIIIGILLGYFLR